jgi:hypothetical protein
MKLFASLVVAACAALVLSQDAQAGSRVAVSAGGANVAVQTGGLFGRRTAVAVNTGSAGVAVAGRRSAVVASGGFSGANVAIAGRRSAVVVEGGFGSNNAAVFVGSSFFRPAFVSSGFFPSAFVGTSFVPSYSIATTLPAAFSGAIVAPGSFAVDSCGNVLPSAFSASGSFIVARDAFGRRVLVPAW